MAAPDEARALGALTSVQSLPAQALDDLVTGEVGDFMLGVFKALARASAPDADDAQLAARVHLMVLAYLMRAVAQGDIEL